MRVLNSSGISKGLLFNASFTSPIHVNASLGPLVFEPAVPIVPIVPVVPVVLVDATLAESSPTETSAASSATRLPAPENGPGCGLVTRAHSFPPSGLLNRNAIGIDVSVISRG